MVSVAWCGRAKAAPIMPPAFHGWWSVRSVREDPRKIRTPADCHTRTGSDWAVPTFPGSKAYHPRHLKRRLLELGS